MTWTVRLVDATTQTGWDQMYRRHPMARTIVPTWEVLAGWQNFQVALLSGQEVVGGLILSIQRIPYSPMALTRINCLMVGPDHAPAMLETLMRWVDRWCLKHLALETELRLRLPISEGAQDATLHREVWQALEALGYRTLRKADTTYFVPLQKDDEALLNGFERSARNKIRKAEREGLSVECSNDYNLLDDFYSAYLEMCARKKAPVQPEALVGRGLRPLVEQGTALLFVERYPKGISNLVIVDALGIPCYVLGTRSPANVRGEVPGAAQALHYAIMRRLRDQGHAWYDLGGCEGPVPIEGHPNFGVWRFKYGFGGEFVRFMPYLRKVRGPLERPFQLLHALRGDYV